jgi:hypothetical protein
MEYYLGALTPGALNETLKEELRGRSLYGRGAIPGSWRNRIAYAEKILVFRDVDA